MKITPVQYLRQLIDNRYLMIKKTLSQSLQYRSLLLIGRYGFIGNVDIELMQSSCNSFLNSLNVQQSNKTSAGLTLVCRCCDSLTASNKLVDVTTGSQALSMNHTNNTIWRRIIIVYMRFSTSYPQRQLKVKIFNKNGLRFSIRVLFALGVVILPI